MSQTFINIVKKGRFADYDWDKSEPVETNTLDNMIKKYGTPKFIKIDVEGYEYKVLQGLTKPVEYISIEFTPELLEATLDCIKYLPEGKYNYGSQEQSEFYFKTWVDKKTIIHHLKSIKDYKIEFGDVYIKHV
jgi:hypothetical protein